jgi:DNA-binding response OmpR family regulator
MAERVLVVDDEKSIRRVVEYALEEGGFEVLSAGRGDDALEIIEKQPVDLVVLDLMLPGIDGIEVCRRIRATRNVPIIMLSARDDEVDKVLGLEMGADDYVTKPFSPRELVSRVKANLRRARVVPVRVMDCNGSGSGSAILAGIDWVAARGVKPGVVNLSLGGSASSTLDAAVQRLVRGPHGLHGRPHPRRVDERSCT